MTLSRTGFATPRPVRLADLAAGVPLLADRHHACLTEGLHRVEADDEGDLFIRCDHGRHYLELHLGEGGVLRGLSRVAT